MTSSSDSEPAVQGNPVLTAVLHQHLQSIAAKPISPRMLAELERTCLLTRELMAVGKHPTALAKRHFINNSYLGDEGDIGPMPYMGGMSASAAMSSPNETFGVSAIRELVNGLAALQPKPANNDTFADLTSAIIAAKNGGDTELEAQLRETLRRKSGVESPEVTPGYQCAECGSKDPSIHTGPTHSHAPVLEVAS